MRKTGKTTKYKNGKKEVIHKGFKLPAQLETTLNLDVLNEIINGSLVTGISLPFQSIV